MRAPGVLRARPRHDQGRPRRERPLHRRGRRPPQPGRRPRGQPARPGHQLGAHARPASSRPTTSTSTPVGAGCRSPRPTTAAGSRGSSASPCRSSSPRRNMAFSMAPLLTQGAIDLLMHHGDEEQKETLPHEDGDRGVDRHHEPHRAAGRLRRRRRAHQGGARRTTAPTASPARRSSSPSASTTWPRTSSTWCSPARPTRPPGTKGISLLHRARSSCVNDDGASASATTSRCVSIEHKMGIKASPTCVMSYGEDGDGAVGYLIGEENQGMRYMFTMMNNARLSVGPRGPRARRARLPEGPRSTPRSATRAGRRARPPGETVARSSSTPTCAGCCSP